jgi:two-component system NarL family response regulator
MAPTARTVDSGLPIKKDCSGTSQQAARSSGGTGLREISKGTTSVSQEKNQWGSDHNAQKPLTILVADDHPVVREGLVSLINRQPDMRVIGEASNGQEAVEKYFALHPDVVLLDLRMPVIDGIEVVKTICAKDPSARLIVVTLYRSEEDVYRSLQAGAQGYALKDASLDQLINCIHAVGNGQTWIPPDVGAKLAKRVTDPELTPRESEVLHAVALGKSNKEIGSQFNISEGTVKVHMTHILEKLKVAGRTEAINVAVKRGLVRLDGGGS